MLVFFALLGIGTWLAYKKLMTVPEAGKLDVKHYKAELDSIKSYRKKLRAENVSLATLKQAFVKKISEKVFPYWYGTKWDFNGTTEQPGEGAIACGYFVTTTIRDMGYPINRSKMAQCASEEMITSLAGKKNVTRFSNVTLKAFHSKLNSLGEGLYIVGLDNHTGFLLVDQNGSFFIHSSGWFPFKVVKEKVETSGILERSKYKVIGKISDDEDFLRTWVNS